MTEPAAPEVSSGARGFEAVLGGCVALVVFGMIWVAMSPAPHNGGDNAGYITLAYSLLTEGAYLELWDPLTPIHTKYPPFYPLILAVGMGLGLTSWMAFKSFSALCIAASTVVVYAWVAERRGPWTGAALAVVVGLCPAFLWASNWILSDPLFLLLTVTSLYALTRAERDRERRTGLWIGVGCAAAILATFTRTAGLPLVLAAGGALLLAGRKRAAAGFAAAFLVPSLGWWLRSRSAGAQYVSEFWMVNPYSPEEGRAGIGDLLARVFENLRGYTLEHIPGGLATYPQGGLALLGVVLAVVAGVGWVHAARKRVGVTELFLPAYFGLILLWPAVWSGDRFALPLYPVVLFFALDGLDATLGRVKRWAPTAAAAALGAVLLIPSLSGWNRAVQGSRACAAVVSDAGPFACYGQGFYEFVGASRWLGENAPDGAAVLTRKPRIFYTLSGLPSRTYPFTTDPDAFLAEARAVGARYVVLDLVGRQGVTYVGAVVSARPEAFCALVGIGGNEVMRTEVLGILTPEESAARGEGATEGIRPCPADMIRSEPRVLPPYSASTLPLLSLATP